MPLIIAEIEDDEPVVTPLERQKLLEFVVEDEGEGTLVESDAVSDDFNDVLTQVQKRKDEQAKREQDGQQTTPQTVTQVSSSAQPPTEPEKLDAKDKASKSPEPAPSEVDKSTAQTESAITDSKISSTPVSTGIRVKNFLEQGKINDNSYWAYRTVEGPAGGFGKKENEKDLTVKSIEGFVKYRFGANWNTLTQ
jgi:hypothetical protein